MGNRLAVIEDAIQQNMSRSHTYLYGIVGEIGTGQNSEVSNDGRGFASGDAD